METTIRWGTEVALTHAFMKRLLAFSWCLFVADTPEGLKRNFPGAVKFVDELHDDMVDFLMTFEAYEEDIEASRALILATHIDISS